MFHFDLGGARQPMGERNRWRGFGMEAEFDADPAVQGVVAHRGDSRSAKPRIAPREKHQGEVVRAGLGESCRAGHGKERDRVRFALRNDRSQHIACLHHRTGAQPFDPTEMPGRGGGYQAQRNIMFQALGRRFLGNHLALQVRQRPFQFGYFHRAGPWFGRCLPVPIPPC